ncbi:MAG: flagellar hook capping FlgD N-terminal domain-containing protein [Burkholderiaceae bacterium]
MDVTSLNHTGNSPTSTATKNAQDTQDRFLKLLVAQMQNQDPMNPMDNAQVTSQMAQIQTVSGISTLDSSIKSLSSQFNQMQALQSVSLVGRDVSLEGNRLSIADGAASGMYELDSAADTVKLEVMTSAGAVLDTVQLGAQGAGRQSFSWPTKQYDDSANLKFRITATKGAATVPSTTYSQDKVVSINTSGSNLQLELAKAGLVDYSSVKTFD